MSEHDWPGHHDDDGSFEHVELPAPDDQVLPEPQDDAWHIPDDDPPALETAWEDHGHLPPAHEELGTLEPEAHEALDDAPAAEDAAVEVFPPMLDVGALPEPVDGWPWIDTGSLGLSHAGIVDQAMLDRLPAQDPQELAAYAAEELPPGADPWATLAASEDPATAALAEYYRPGDQGTAT
ncbi:hypothetical protein [Actinoplanes sp. NBRC 103695]|uniref:hypothetical protein n=1 Tax=Actinoplanes sp. NBRC 103695 TaxID=3032202 RepID=UPI0024A59690|nr:hypothetical protein [Actinoplanes sp. NBRC 103695]GLY95113.1 hypothetical protein Acsp02_23680 [Actinoplanes sp. NBRC 103695]